MIFVNCYDGQQVENLQDYVAECFHYKPSCVYIYITEMFRFICGVKFETEKKRKFFSPVIRWHVFRTGSIECITLN